MALLSKSSILSGIQCPKRLYFKKHHQELASADTGQKLNAIASGIRTGELAHQCFPGGVLVKSDKKGEERELDLIQQTNDLMSSDVPFIFEATFKWEETLVRVDVLERKNRAWNIYEVKSSTTPKKHHALDLAIQVFVLRKSGMIIRKASLMFINNTYVFERKLKIDKLFQFKNMNKKVADFMPLIPSTIKDLKEVVLGDIPDVEIGAHCTSPYTCEFQGHCWKHVPENSILELRGRRELAWEWWEQGIKKLSEVPDSQYADLKEAQIQQIKTAKAREVQVQTEPLKEFLDGLQKPIHFLDFEAFATPAPMVDGTKPYQQIAFQYSLHILNEDLAHREFLHRPGGDLDPRAYLMQQLLQDLEDEGDIVVYNISFERRILQNIAKAKPQFQKAVDKILPRLKDLIDPFEKHWVSHPKMQGKTSIKYVLPALVPEMSYATLDIQNGAEASLAYAELLREGKDDPTIREQLLKYCELDTLAMVKIHEQLKEYAEIG